MTILGIALGMLLGLLIAYTSQAEAPQSNNDETNIVAGTPTTTIETKIKINSTIPADMIQYSKEEVIALIQKYSAEYGIPSANPLAIAKCESGFNWNSKNKNSTASGVFQFIRSTWMGTEEAKQGRSVFDADANIKAAIRHIASKGTSPWNASIDCWKNDKN